MVSRSSVEAEYRAMATTISEILWMRWLLNELEVKQSGTVPLFCDSEAARHIANNLVFHERQKHVKMDCHFVRERVESKEIQPSNIHTREQIAELFTKSFGAQQFRLVLDKLGTFIFQLIGEYWIYIFVYIISFHYSLILALIGRDNFFFPLYLSGY